ncbi:MAG: hypothetical protein B7Y39_16700 [Bdellovibrio sp. 28-41-41]|nr:MAG: hypothetical protein B7Y39_16700 [Bdellovibrio sp. 28-41-41]
MELENLNQLKLLRKYPTQDRSKGLVKIIIEATAQVLSSQSHAKLTLEKVSRRSGVAVGSIYQYFRNKKMLTQATFFAKAQSLVDEILEQQEQTAKDSIDAKTTLRRMSDNLVEKLIQEDGLFARLQPLLSGLGLGNSLLKFRNIYRIQILKILRPWIRPNITEAKIEAVSYVIVNAVMGVLLAQVNGYKFQSDKQSLKDEIFDLLWNYVQPYLNESKQELKIKTV